MSPKIFFLICALLYLANGAPTDKCPEISLPVLSPLCEFGPTKNDTNGCPIAPDIICKAVDGQSSEKPSPSVTAPTKTSSTGPTTSTSSSQQSSSTQPQPQTSKTLQTQVKVEPPQPVIVSQLQVPSKPDSAVEILRQNAGSVSEFSVNETVTEEPPKNFTFEDMLGTDFLHVMNISKMPEAEEFRKAKGPPENASGKFHRCKVPADCYNFREPAEWCKPKKNVQWKGKSCFCATDTMTPSCIVERTDGDKNEWTFCSSFLDLKCI